MTEDGYTAIPTADCKPYTELPPEERKQVEEFMKNLKSRKIDKENITH